LLLDVGKFGVIRVSLREHRVLRTPVDCQSRVIPKNAVFVGLTVVITAFVKELNRFRHSQETVSKTNWDIDLVLFLCGKANGSPLAKMGRANADVHDDIQSFAFADATELRLRMLKLIVKAAKCLAGGDRVIVLEEDVFDAEVDESGVMVAFEEGTAGVAMDYGTQLTDTWQGGFDSFHLR
jgi:hypothetical protein